MAPNKRNTKNKKKTRAAKTGSILDDAATRSLLLATIASAALAIAGVIALKIAKRYFGLTLKTLVVALWAAIAPWCTFAMLLTTVTTALAIAGACHAVYLYKKRACAAKTAAEEAALEKKAAEKKAATRSAKLKKNADNRDEAARDYAAQQESLAAAKAARAERMAAREAEQQAYYTRLQEQRAAERARIKAKMTQWKTRQQDALEEALTLFPLGSCSAAQRWSRISNMVGTKTPRECAARCEELRAELEARSASLAVAGGEESGGGLEMEDIEEEYDETWEEPGWDEDFDADDVDTEDGGGNCENDYDFDLDVFMGNASIPNEVGGDSEGEEEGEEETGDSSDAFPAMGSGAASTDERERVGIELDPVRKGTEVFMSKEKLVLWNVATVRVDTLRLQVLCQRCGKSSAQVEMSGTYKNQSTARPRCSCGTHQTRMTLRPCFMHANSCTLGYVDSLKCLPVDLLRLDVVVACLECGEDNVLREVQRGIEREVACRGCYKKVALRASDFGIKNVDAGAGAGGAGTISHAQGAADSVEQRLKALRKKQQKTRGGISNLGLVAGTPLPKTGSCKHYRRSLRWLRFGCCGRAFPCSQCHAASDCPAAKYGVRAKRMLCGRCSREQPYHPTLSCRFCRFHMGVTGGGSKSHWQGGCGTRDTSKLSKKDRRKNKGESRSGTKKTASGKSKRVGTAGKSAREKKAKAKSAAAASKRDMRAAAKRG